LGGQIIFEKEGVPIKPILWKQTWGKEERQMKHGFFREPDLQDSETRKLIIKQQTDEA